MNIQIFGRPKCFDSKKAERYFKERRVKFQYVDLNRYGLSRGELRSVAQALGGFDAILQKDTAEYEASFIAHLAHSEDIEQKILDNPGLLKSPIVRCGKKAAVGYVPEVWKAWE